MEDECDGEGVVGSGEVEVMAGRDVVGGGWEDERDVTGTAPERAGVGTWAELGGGRTVGYGREEVELRHLLRLPGRHLTQWWPDFEQEQFLQVPERLQRQQFLTC